MAPFPLLPTTKSQIPEDAERRWTRTTGHHTKNQILVCPPVSCTRRWTCGIAALHPRATSLKSESH
ncbi:hypothetical protein FIBSPDRAFT_860072 [Athelia psychrophila]|uniref:Uncharacterized protein n=1 Tax=Athelia psychrophila TaxID=1759441 RepID=A0A166KHM6_9AGAM|nr:hypothetical protein FIBSPDRAFT_860066 [Fibularhizoctonia sp. CBS 109695]KZP21919.1 hypothetical protein FIBSPDRAFT_860072 [Fibularhizoctonia sp. CBS 109695]